MRATTNIFVAGSRHISRLSKDVRTRLDNIVEQRFTILLGDANGVDKAVQRYLNRRHYEAVVVFCMEGICRNNLGGWPIRAIAASGRSKRGFSYYSTKDQAMAEQAHYGLMLWDGKSRGTLRSIIDLVNRSKPVVVYVAPDKSFHSLRNKEDLARMLARYDSRSRGSGFDDDSALAVGKSHRNDPKRLFVES